MGIDELSNSSGEKNLRRAMDRLRRSPNDPHLLEEAADALSRCGQHDEAEDFYIRAAEEYEEKGLIRRAASICDQLLLRVPDHPRARAVKARLHEEEEDQTFLPPLLGFDGRVQRGSGPAPAGAPPRDVEQPPDPAPEPEAAADPPDAEGAVGPEAAVDPAAVADAPGSGGGWLDAATRVAPIEAQAAAARSTVDEAPQEDAGGGDAGGWFDATTRVATIDAAATMAAFDQRQSEERAASTAGESRLADEGLPCRAAELEVDEWADETVEVDEAYVVDERLASNPAIAAPRRAQVETEPVDPPPDMDPPHDDAALRPQGTDDIPIQLDLSEIPEEQRNGLTSEEFSAIFEDSGVFNLQQQIEATGGADAPIEDLPTLFTADVAGDVETVPGVESARGGELEELLASTRPPDQAEEDDPAFDLHQTVFELRSTLEKRPVRPVNEEPLDPQHKAGERRLLAHAPHNPTLDLTLLPDDFERLGRLVRVEPGELLLREKDKSNGLFVLKSGRAEIVKSIRVGGGKLRSAYLGLLEPGACFGELALLGDGVRHAAVRALEPCELITFGKPLVKRWAAESPALNKALRRMYRDRLRGWVQVYSPLLNTLEASKAAAFVQSCKPRGVAAGKTILRQGSRAPGLYLVLLGMVDVKHTGDDGWSEMMLHRLRDGDFFGEVTLMLDEPSPAYYVTRTFTQLLYISKEELFRFGAHAPELLRICYDEARKRRAGYGAITSGEAQYEQGTTVYLLEKKKE